MKNKIIKKTPIIVLATLLLSIPITQTHAYTFNVDFADTGSSSSSSGKPGGDGSSGNQEPKYSKELSSKTGEENGYKYKETYTCKYNYNISSTNKVTINGYNMQNKKIIENSLNISDKNKIVAGTSIGLEIYEVKKISYSVSDIEVVYTKVKTEKKETKCQAYTCNYSCTARGSSPYTVQKSVSAGYACSKGNEKSTMTMHSCVNTTSSPTCSSYKTGWTDTNETITKRTYTSESNNYVKDCLKHAVKVAKGKANATGTSATYSIKVPESNNINKTSITTIQGKVTKEEKFNVSKNTEQKSGTRTVEYEYSTNPCMNVITSEVRYVSDSKYCNKDNEILIANETIDGRTHWHYFTPINTKSSDYITIELTKNTNNSNNKKSNKECLYVLEKNPIDPLDNNKTSYVDLIQKTNDEKLVGDYTGNKSSKDYKYFKNGGTCYLTSVIKIPINQKFYQEEQDNDGNIKFTGFNFYYRPININNPFPNGFSENSYWKKWDEDGRKDPNMAESYKITTYSAININTEAVRNYKNTTTNGKQNTYSSWNNMTKDGKSNFISSQGIVIRHKTGDYYKIGEGPSVTIKNGQAIMTGSDN